MSEQDDAHEGRDQTASQQPRTFLDAYRSELTTIAARRKNAGELQIEVPEGAEPDTVRGLVGLCLSGGGIRSAIFSLGVVQALQRNGRLRAFDYLSTVSGGGYTGSMLSSLLNREAATSGDFELRKEAGEAEHPALSHLREGSNYLSPGGLINALRLPMVLLRGLVLNLVVLIPLTMLAVSATEYLYEGGNWDEAQWLVRWATALFAAGVVLATVFRVARPVGWEGRERLEKVQTWMLLAVICSGLLLPVMQLAQVAIDTPSTTIPFFRTGVEQWMSHLVSAHGPLLVAAVPLIVGALRGLMAPRGRRGRIAIFVISALGPLIVLSMFLLLCWQQADSPFLEKKYESVLDAWATGAAHSDDDLREYLKSTGILSEGNLRIIEASEAAQEASLPLSPLDQLFTALGVERPPPTLRWRIVTSEHHGEEAYRIYQEQRGSKDVFRIAGGKLSWGNESSELVLASDQVFLGIGVGWLLLSLLLININHTSFHFFYRDRLSRLFLFRPEPGDEVQPNDELKLSQLNGKGSAAPYHLLNAAVNLGGGTGAGRSGRRADFFVFSRNHCGSDATGYCATEDLEHADGELRVASAMAISAAAASPNMGKETVRGLVFVMTLLNVRLGYWLPNPARVAAHAGRSGFWTWWAPGPLTLVREALGWVSPWRRHLLGGGTSWRRRVNVSDGGHLENLGLYELLRRRCRFIVAVDGEADPEMTFGSLMTLMRYAKIDLGVGIEIDESLSRVRPGDDGLSECQWALGAIDYGNGQQGTLLYIKSSVTGDEPPYVRRYRAREGAFPHQSTADQFFDEEQFEAYRALGAQAGESALDDPEVRNLFETRGRSPMRSEAAPDTRAASSAEPQARHDRTTRPA